MKQCEFLLVTIGTGEYGHLSPVWPELGISAVFGQIKYDGGFKRFHYRGNRLVRAEFSTVAIAHNIKKMASLSTSKS